MPNEPDRVSNWTRAARAAHLAAERHTMPNATFDAHLARMAAIHAKKAADYSADDQPYGNFLFAATVAGCSVDTVFRTLIGVKLARLDELLKGKIPQNESLDDSLLDLSVYTALWASYRASLTA